MYVTPNLHDLAVAALKQTGGKVKVRLPDKLSEFNPATTAISAVDYIADVECILLSNLYPPERWSAALSSLVKGTAAAWAPSCYTVDGQPKPWAEVKANFLKTFSRSDVLHLQR